MSQESTFVAKWETVDGETETKRFQSVSYPRVETHGERITPDSTPAVYDIYADDERELSVLANRFIHIRRE